MSTPNQQAIADIARSGLTAADAKVLQLQPLAAAETAALLESPSLGKVAYKLPYFDLFGKPTEFYRVRLLETVHDKEGKELRYLQPDDTLPHAYFPPYEKIPWSVIAGDASRTITFTEGEKKAAKACKTGIATIGLGGVWNFRSKDAHIDFLYELATFVWADRKVEIAYDATVGKPNENVEYAARKLTERLVALGASVSNVRLPPGQKLDDYLKDHTLAEYAALPRTTINGWAPPAVVTYGASFDPAKIPQREWVIYGRYALGEGTCIVGPPATNKSMLLLMDAVQIATGRNLLGQPIKRKGHVLLLAGEDGRRDVEARLAAIYKKYEISPAEAADRLHVVYQTEIDDPGAYNLASMADDVAAMNHRMMDWLRDYPDLVAIFIDPLAVWHQLVENSNDALQVLCTGLRRLAAQTHRVVAFDHHVNKVSMADVEAHVRNLASVRGGSVLIASMRWAFTTARIKAETAKAYGISDDDRKFYRRVDSLKASYGPDSEEPALMRIDSVLIANGESVGVMVPVDAEALRARGIERKEDDDKLLRDALGSEFVKMLEEKAPRSAKEAALWFNAHAPLFFANRKTGEVLAERTVRDKLARVIGSGIDTKLRDGTAVRVVATITGKGNGMRHEINFAAPGEGPGPKRRSGGRSGE